jgi:hypothetical protein
MALRGNRESMEVIEGIVEILEALKRDIVRGA